MIFTVFLLRIIAGTIIVLFGTLVSIVGYRDVVPIMWIDDSKLTDLPLGRAFRLYGYGLMRARNMWR